jgi:putative FmdB family regulatory protein
MPTYDFICPNGHDIEKFYRSIASAPTEIVCPTCGEPSTRQMSAGAGLVFKGSGFYITDYGKDGKKDQRAAEKAAGVKKAETKKDTKPSKSSDS